MVAVAADGLAVDAALRDLTQRWWLQWQQIDELAVDAALMDLRLRRCIYAGGGSGSRRAGSGCSSDLILEAALVVAVAARELAAGAALMDLRLRWW